MKKSLIAGASVMALAGAIMPVAGVFAEPVQDTIKVTVNDSCSFTAGGTGATYEASGANGASVQPTKSGGNNTHAFTIFCNKKSGYTVSATATALTNANLDDTFAYKATLGTDAGWHADITTSESTGLTVDSLPDGGAATTVVTGTGIADGKTFSAAYTAKIGTTTQAGVYTGTISYTLAAA